MNQTTKQKALKLINRFEIWLDNQQKEIDYCKKTIKEIKKEVH